MSADNQQERLSPREELRRDMDQLRLLKDANEAWMSRYRGSQSAPGSFEYDRRAIEIKRIERKYSCDDDYPEFSH